jgi:hypothetical protein
MTKNNKVECWKPKNCGKSSSKCGDCITLQLQLLDEWVPNIADDISVIAIYNFQNNQPTTYNPFFIAANIPKGAKGGNIFPVDICKSNIINNTLYYLIADKYAEARGQISIPFTVNTSKCVNTIPIDNSCPKHICQETTITFVLTGDGNDYVFGGTTTYTSSNNNDCLEYAEAEASFESMSNTLILNYVVNKSIIVNSLKVKIGTTTIYYYKDPSGLIIDLTQKCSQTITLSFTDFNLIT